MAQANDTLGIIHQNLIDAGCDKTTIESCMAMAQKGTAYKMLPVLNEYKASLLGAVRTRQKQIDCLDFLIFKLQKSNNR